MKYHLIGIGGVGMAGLAVLLKNRGHEVSGCDVHLGPRTAWLESLGIRVFEGHSPDHLADVDEVIVTPAVHTDNPERILSQSKYVTRYRGEVLAKLVSDAPDSIAVCGSHGKTTTSTWIAKLLLALGESVEWAIGGETGDFPVAGKEVVSPTNHSIANHSIALSLTPNHSIAPHSIALSLTANHSVLVVEADESDGTLAQYHAKTLVVTNCEYDHPDHFKTYADYLACYETAKQNAAQVIESEGLGGLEGLGSLEGLAPHNRKNARAAIEVALRRGHQLPEILAVLPGIVATLPDRRFQRIWPPTSSQPQLHNQGAKNHCPPPPIFSTSLSIYTDYAHHPTEMACAVKMAREICGGKLRVLFQPHRYSRTKALLHDFPAAFEGADEVVLCPTYAAFEEPIEGGDIADLYRECRNPRPQSTKRQTVDAMVPIAYYAPSTIFMLARTCDEAWEHARNSMQSGDLTLLLGAGDIINLTPKILSDLASPSPTPTPSPSPTPTPSPTPSPTPTPFTSLLIGSGSNTWKSDLNLSVRYVHTTGPADKPGATLGIPWMAGIPGTIGGWVKMNAGAFGHSISEVLEAVKVDGEWIAAADCGFGYRTSNIKGEIQDVRLRKNLEFEGTESAEYYLARRKKFPAGTKGSVFKNPPGDFAGRLLETAGVKGMRVGGAYVWEEHANVIVSGPGANNSDFLALMRLMRNRVLAVHGIDLEPEVCGLN